MTKWGYNVAAAWSQFCNAVLGGHRDQTFSSRSFEARLINKRWAKIVVPTIDALFFWQKDPGHCERCFHADNERTYN